ncbi:TPA: restriction endonuclease subunit S [Mannheimia haemolytica]|uniref:EcoKI restriction-modification system protein HsdS n=3 Tax=Mannheimia haemolytica TaxID=75985 RepID=A0A378NIN0_MANHA|nr:restriction endonuclease subunit S [Mannheimia haemolytica]AGQ38031.1 type I restriction endonuclease subunit S [Mannheimia haemolytica D171]AJE08470.1 restriction endonuclease subunit S [Mannheimia haemolytica USDA-ARS-USMARC-184]EEY08768.1 type I restriction-modification system, subunit S [Mannheimia haemolytica serotype A2 str. OVINE]KYL10422.1 restriction endonuclease HindVIIP subunit S [Mannheimia haemolytica]KYL18801.1 restriction endonuclease HindVIIP subunit S [Mannheimia haemolytic
MSKLSDFISIKHGFAFKGEFITTEENANCLITPVNFSIGGGFKSDKFKYYTGEIPEKYILQPNDLIVTMTDLSKQADTLGYPALVPNISGKKMLHNQRIGLVEFLDNELDKEYLYFLMRTKEYRHQILSTATGATVHHTSPSKILDFEFEKPDLQTQKLIAQYLMILEEKIQLNTQTNQTLEAIAQAIFKSWFVDFDPVRAKAQAILDGKTSDEANLSAMAVFSGKAIEDLSQTEYQELWEIADAFPSEFGDEGLPIGWKFNQADNLFDVGIGKTPPRKESEWFSDNANDTEWISIKDMGNQGLFITESSEYLKVEAVDKFNIKRIPENTVILSFKLTVGRVSITTKETTTNEAIAHFKIPSSSNLSSEFLYCYLKNFDFNNLGSTSSIATAVNSKMIKEMEILEPSDLVINHFNEYIEGIFNKIKENIIQNNNLTKIRDELLPKLLNGELFNE